MFLTLIASTLISVTPADKPAAITEKIREARKAKPAEEIRVKLAPGRYEFSEPLVLGLAESGAENARVVFEGDGKATITGASVLKGWKDEGNGVWSCPAPRNAKGEMPWFNSLWANGRRAACARVPSEGFYRVAEYHFQAYDPAKGTGAGCWEWINLRHCDLSYFRDMPKVDFEHVLLKGNHKWMHSSHALLDWDAPNTTFKIECNSRADYARWNHESLVWFENVRGGFDAPGEWFYDWANKKVCYRPLPGEKLADFVATVPAANVVSVVKIVGDPENGKYVTDVAFDGIAFEGTMADGIHEKNGLVRQIQWQAAPRSGGTIYTRGAKRLAFTNCTISKTENYAFRFDEGTMYVKVQGCELTDLGCGGVFAGNETCNMLYKPEMRKHELTGHLDNVRPTEKITELGPLSVAFLEIDDCLVAHGGLYNPSACGFTLTNVSDSKITHNEIADMYYTGISLGWTWGYWGSVAQRNTVAFNRIHDFGKYVMADMGGVYTLGASFGTCISNNVIYNVCSASYGGWGMYNDEGSEGTTWENNIVYNTTTSSYHLHFGRDNVVRNNIMGYQKNERIIVTASNPKDHGVLFDRNIVIWDEQHSIVGGQVFRFDNGYGGWEPGAVWTNNLFWCTTEKWDLGGAHGTYADPKFVDPANRDFRLQPDSPAFALGFKPIDASLAGRRRK